MRVTASIIAFMPPLASQKQIEAQAMKQLLSTSLRWVEGALRRHGRCSNGDAPTLYRLSVLGRSLCFCEAWPIDLVEILGFRPP